MKVNYLKNIFINIFLFLSIFVFLIPNIFASSLLDSDYDGLTDEAEIKLYKTDPMKADTDGDGFIDSQEITNMGDPLKLEITPMKSEKIPIFDREDPIAWHIARISGIAAFILMTFVVLLGLIQSSRSLVKYKFMSMITAQEIHRIISWSGLAMVLLHVVVLLFDDVFNLKISELFIPLSASRSFVSTKGFDYAIPISMGVVALYIIIILVVTSELRQSIVSMKFWRAVHYLSFVGYLLFLIHGFTAGSDSDQPWMLAIYIWSFASVLLFLLARIFKKKLFYRVVTKPADPKAQTSQTSVDPEN